MLHREQQIRVEIGRRRTSWLFTQLNESIHDVYRMIYSIGINITINKGTGIGTGILILRFPVLCSWSPEDNAYSLSDPLTFALAPL